MNEQLFPPESNESIPAFVESNESAAAFQANPSESQQKTESAILLAISALKSELDSLVTGDRAMLQRNFDDLYEERKRLNDDFYNNLRAPFIRQIISIRETLNSVLEANRNDTEQTAAERIVEVLASCVAYVDGVLRNNQVSWFIPQAGEAFVPDIHTSTGSQPTDDKASDGLIARCVHPGYMWECSAARKLIKPAEVEIYKYNKKGIWSKFMVSI